MSDADYARQYQLMGETIIVRALSNVNYLLVNSRNYAKKEKTVREIRKKECLRDLEFVNNGGLEKVINFFQLDLDAENLYHTFYYKTRQRKEIF